MLSIESTAGRFKSFIEDLQRRMKDWISRQIEAHLEREVEAWLKRPAYGRRSRVRRHQTRAQCCRCGTRHAHHFSRNGHRARKVVTSFGVLTIWLPRVVCDCGGSVEIPFSI